MPVYCCCVKGCQNTSDRSSSKGIFYDGDYVCVPPKPERRKVWNHLTGSNTDVKKYVCAEHFTDDDWHVAFSKRKLKPDAVPSRKLPSLKSKNKDVMDERARKLLLVDTLTEYEKNNSLQNNHNKELSVDPLTLINSSANDENMSCEDDNECVSEVEEPDKERQRNYIYQPQKCAEITVDVNDLTFAVNCSHCVEIFIDLSSFVNHIKTKHTSLLKIHTDNPLDDINEETDPPNMAYEETLIENRKDTNIFVKEAATAESYTPTKESHEDVIYTSDSDSSCSAESTDIEFQPVDSNEYNEIQCDNQPLVTQVIYLLKQNPIIWNTVHPLYKNYKKRKTAVRELINSLRKSFPDLPFTYNNVSTLINRLLLYYENDVKQIQDAKEKKRKYEPLLWCYKELHFLGDFEDPLTCISSQAQGTNVDKEPNKSVPTTPKYKPIGETAVHECEHCEKQFPKAYKLKRHMRLHSDERPYICSTCGNGFRSYSTWFRHERAHMKNKPFKCKECERSYYTAGMLRTHQKSHLNIRDKICDICGKSFTSSKYLNRHREVHVDEPKHTCSCCGKKFKQYSNMWSHRKRCIELHTVEKVEINIETDDMSSIPQITED